MKHSVLLLCLLGALCLGSVSARKAKPVRPFPALVDCNQKADGTPFRINTTVVKAVPAQTYCFSFGSGDAASATAPCGKATILERVNLWAKYDLRSKITTMRIRDNNGEKVVFGSWAKRGESRDELVFSQLKWSADYIATARPRICLTLAADATLDDICLGPGGACTFGLYSLGASGSKCCPVYQVPVAPSV